MINMKELEKMAADLNERYDAKVKEMDECPNFDSHRQGLLNLRKQAIEYFETMSNEAAKTASQDPTTKRGIIEEYQKKAYLITKDINDIIC
jgi:hypothetical protein